MKKTLLFLVVMLMALTTFAKDIKTLVVTTTPKMHCESCENKIKKNMRFEKGVKKVETDLKSQHVTITYDPGKNNVEGLRQGMKKIGYETKVVSDQPVKKTHS